MNNTELEALRRHLFFSVAEAARMVSHSSDRAWRNWEAPPGDPKSRKVPADVAAAMQMLVDWRLMVADEMHAAIADMMQASEVELDEGEIVLVWYDSLDDWLSKEIEAIYWRPHCSVIAEIAAEFRARIVCFDLADYRRWLGGQDDSESMRAAWAAQVPFSPSR